MVYIKYRVEGWIEVHNEEVFNKRGIELEAFAYEMSQGNGICTLWEEVTRETEANAPTMEDSAISFFNLELDEEDKEAYRIMDEGEE